MDIEQIIDNCINQRLELSDKPIICAPSDNWEKYLIKTTDVVNKGDKEYYTLRHYCGFDIETTNVEYIKDKRNVRRAYMYVWQMAIDNVVIIGRKWDEFKAVLDRLIKYFDLEKNTAISNQNAEKKSNNEEPTPINIITMWVHNLSFESSFILPRFCEDITDGFYKAKREPLYFTYKTAIRFQDSAMISGCSLENTANIYNLKNKKMAGDLDYSIRRNSQTPLDETERGYIINDVLILRDFAKVIYDDIIPTNFNKLPLTKTQICLNQIYNALGWFDYKQINKIILSFEEYQQARTWLYRGGYVHANSSITGVLLDNIKSVDFTSSYPAVMNHGYYPVTKFYERKLRNKDSFYWYLKNRCCWFEIIFYDIKAKTNHTIESQNKIIEYTTDAIFDNGRLYKATSIRVQLTELDFDIYEHFYSWSGFTLVWFKQAKRGQLWDSVLDVLNDNYLTKADYKQKGLKNDIRYVLAKEFINSVYGAFVKRINLENWTYNKKWLLVHDLTPEEMYQKAISKRKKLPYQIGIWVTARARWNLLVRGVAKCGDNVCYCDTDSMKIRDYDSVKKWVDIYNKDIEKANKKLVEKNPLFYDLGMFDENDGDYTKFVTLGAKRYAYIDKDDNKLHTVVSGLKKGTIEELEQFKNGLTITKEDANKITSAYNDEPHEDIIMDEYGNSEVMHEDGSCCLYAVGFKLGLSPEYKRFLQDNFERKVL